MTLDRMDLQSIELDVGHIRRLGVDKYLETYGKNDLLVKRLEQLLDELKRKR